MPIQLDNKYFCHRIVVWIEVCAPGEDMKFHGNEQKVLIKGTISN